MVTVSTVCFNVSEVSDSGPPEVKKASFFSNKKFPRFDFTLPVFPIKRISTLSLFFPLINYTF
jgi:hypothetical protein